MSAPAGSTELVIGTADAIKLAVPFVTAIVLVWIKGWIEGWIARDRKQRALWRLVVNELGSIGDTVQSFHNIALSAQAGKLRLVALTTPTLLSKLSTDLADLDPTHAYLYGDLDAWVAIVNAGLARLAALQMARVSATGDTIDKLDRVIFGQSRISASDAISLSEAAVAALRCVPARNRQAADPDRVMRTLDTAVAEARQAWKSWPKFADGPVSPGPSIAGPATAPTIVAAVPPTTAPLMPRTRDGDDAFVDDGG